MENIINKQEIAPLPFTYKRTYDLTKAADQEWRISPVSIIGQENRPRTDSQILAMIKERREQENWFITEHWRKKDNQLSRLSLQ